MVSVYICEVFFYPIGRNAYRTHGFNVRRSPSVLRTRIDYAYLVTAITELVPDLLDRYFFHNEHLYFPCPPVWPPPGWPPPLDVPPLLAGFPPPPCLPSPILDELFCPLPNDPDSCRFSFFDLSWPGIFYCLLITSPNL